MKISFCELKPSTAPGRLVTGVTVAVRRWQTDSEQNVSCYREVEVIYHSRLFLIFIFYEIFQTVLKHEKIVRSRGRRGQTVTEISIHFFSFFPFELF